MAEMIPDSISLSPTATNGEKRLFHLLQEALQPDEDFLVWYDMTVGNKHPDFIVYGQYYGLLILEVKDWTLQQVRELNREKFTVVLAGNVQKCDSPLTQARKAYGWLMDTVKKYPGLLHPDGAFKGQPHFPIGYAAVFTNITRGSAEKHRLLSVLDKDLCLFADDLQFEPTDRAAQRAFLQRLKPCFNVNARFQCAPLDHAQLKVLRYAIFPEVRIAGLHRNGGDGTVADLRTLDKEQERVAKSIGWGHRILKGVAGSGKTLVVAARAKYLKQCHPDWRILVLCYNVSLSKYIRHFMKIAGDELDLDGIDVMHFHGLVKTVLGPGLFRDFSESFEAWETRITDAFCRAATAGMAFQLQRRHRMSSQYDAVLIDEGQDFTIDMVRGLVSLLNPDTDSLLFCYDPSQNVFGRETPRWKDAGLAVQGKRPIELRTSYRSTSEIMDLATRFAQMPSQQEMTLESVLIPAKLDRHGAAPVLKFLAHEQAVNEYILDQIASWIRDNMCNWGDVGILYATPYNSFPLEFNAAFYSRFKFSETERLFWVNQTHDSKAKLDLSEQSIKMCTIESSKGLEFKRVFLVGLDLMPRSKRSIETERRLAYVAMTRAQEELYIPYIKTSSFVEEVEQLIQGMQKFA